MAVKFKEKKTGPRIINFFLKLKDSGLADLVILILGLLIAAVIYFNL